MGTSADPKADIRRADELVSQALALDPTSPGAHSMKGWIPFDQGRFEEAIAEQEPALAWDPDHVVHHAGVGLGLPLPRAI